MHKLGLAQCAFVLLAAISLIGIGYNPEASAANGRTAKSPPGIEGVYKLGAGDQVRIIVFGEEDLSGEFTVAASGDVSLPLIGQVLARGLSLRSFEAVIEKKLSDGYLKKPRVNAEVVSFRPFYIIGEVNKSGEYPYVAGMNLIKAIAMAEGFTYRANQKKIHVTRARTGTRITVRVGEDVLIFPEDVIEVPERFF